MKKKLLVLAIVGLFLTGTFGCTASGVLKAISTLHDGIKLIVNDPLVKKQIPKDRFDRLIAIDIEYNKAAADIEATGLNNASPLSIIIDCADEVLAILGDLVLGSKYKEKIEALKTPLQVLKLYVRSGG